MTRRRKAYVETKSIRGVGALPHSFDLAEHCRIVNGIE